jgi:sensor histidine kinase YesM
MIRFENKFDFNIELVNKVDVDNIEIPSLLIQPYVENAILHGLYNKNEKGALSIRIREEDEVVIFEIEDDGVGREVAKKIRQQSFPTHKSMGIKLTEERLKLINHQNLASFEIEDLMNEHGAAGTRVTIRIAL